MTDIVSDDNLKVKKQVFEDHGWRFTTTIGPILSSADRDRWQEDLGLHELPEMLFGYNAFTVECLNTGFSYDFSPYEALRCVSKNLPDIEVAPSAKWKELNKEKLEKYGKTTTPFDWTYETAYGGDISSKSSTYTTNSQAPIDDGIPIPLLMKNEPITKYFEVYLYEDELADNGIAQALLRCRIMPTYWYCLFRYWLRVDGVKFKIIDTRLFCEFGKNKIIQERIVKEGDWDSVNKRAHGNIALIQDPNLFTQHLRVTSSKLSHIMLIGN